MAIRILMINDHLHFGGGGDAVFRLEREAYEKAGHEVFTFSQSADLAQCGSEHEFVCLERKGRLARKVGKFLGAPRVFSSLTQVLAQTKPDLVRVHLVSKYPASIYPALSGYPVIQTLHGPNLFCATSWGNLREDSSDCEMGIGGKCWTRGCMSLGGALLYSFLDARVRPSVKKVVQLFHCPSRQIEKKAMSLGYGPTIHIPLGIDPDFTQSKPATHDGSPTIIYVGALVEEKGLLNLPDALYLIKQKIPDVRLVLCGRGVLEQRLKNDFLLRDLIGNVMFRGFVEHNNIIKEYQKAQVLVLPSIWSEQFGLVGPEAMACGIPCVATNVGGIPEWLKDGERGFLVPPRDFRALADRITILLLDRDLRLKFAEAGRAYSKLVHDSEVYQSHWLKISENYNGK